MIDYFQLQAKKEYEAEAVHRIQIYFADSYGSWRWTDSRHKRPISSIVLNPGVKEMLVSDTKDFLKSEKVSHLFFFPPTPRDAFPRKGILGCRTDHRDSNND